MTEAPSPFAEPDRKHPPPVAHVPRSDASAAWSPAHDEPVEVVTPDRHCADLLLEHAAPLIPAELLPGPGWVVRFEAPPAGKGGWWMLEVLSLLDRWLESVPIPCARVLYGGHSYVIRSSTEPEPQGPTSRAALAAAHALAH